MLTPCLPLLVLFGDAVDLHAGAVSTSLRTLLARIEILRRFLQETKNGKLPASDLRACCTESCTPRCFGRAVDDLVTLLQILLVSPERYLQCEGLGNDFETRRTQEVSVPSMLYAGVLFQILYSGVGGARFLLLLCLNVTTNGNSIQFATLATKMAGRSVVCLTNQSINPYNSKPSLLSACTLYVLKYSYLRVYFDVLIISQTGSMCKTLDFKYQGRNKSAGFCNHLP